jgi:hypothetical protein
VKMLGLGMATAILLDATVVRMVLVPATMAMLGRWNWWLPRWLDRALPGVSVDGERGLADPAEPGWRDRSERLRPLAVEAASDRHPERV